jgi:uncharacterized protein (UPF0179 family)
MYNKKELVKLEKEFNDALANDKGNKESKKAIQGAAVKLAQYRVDYENQQKTKKEKYLKRQFEKRIKSLTKNLNNE